MNKRLDDMKARKLTVGRTWAFSLGTGENADGRAQARAASCRRLPPPAACRRHCPKPPAATCLLRRSAAALFVPSAVVVFCPADDCLFWLVPTTAPQPSLFSAPSLARITFIASSSSLILSSQALQLQPGVYDEEVFKGLDYSLVQAKLRGIKLILCIEDYWLSVDRYIAWSPTAGSKTDFYTDWTLRGLYKNHLQYFVNRVNTISGVQYRDDPTIMAWNIMNEPRCTGCGSALQGWVDEMTMYLKAIDPYHMITIGEEGFYSRTCERVHLNPGAGKRRTGIASSPWALQEGQDFMANHRGDSIDFSTVHAWPDNWLGFADFSPIMSNPVSCHPTTLRCAAQLQCTAVAAAAGLGWRATAERFCSFCFDVLVFFFSPPQSFDYQFGNEVWREKLDYLIKWLVAHVEDSDKMGLPIIFGAQLNLLMVGEWMIVWRRNHPEEQRLLAGFRPAAVTPLIQSHSLCGDPLSCLDWRLLLTRRILFLRRGLPAGRRCRGVREDSSGADGGRDPRVAPPRRVDRADAVRAQHVLPTGVRAGGEERARKGRGAGEQLLGAVPQRRAGEEGAPTTDETSHRQRNWRAELWLRVHARAQDSQEVEKASRQKHPRRTTKTFSLRRMHCCSQDPYRVTIDDQSTFDVIASHQGRLGRMMLNRTKARRGPGAAGHCVLFHSS